MNFVPLQHQSGDKEEIKKFCARGESNVRTSTRIGSEPAAFDLVGHPSMSICLLLTKNIVPYVDF
jgi:hypothetical protein